MIHITASDFIIDIIKKWYKLPVYNVLLLSILRHNKICFLDPVSAKINRIVFCYKHFASFINLLIVLGKAVARKASFPNANW